MSVCQLSGFCPVSVVTRDRTNLVMLCRCLKCIHSKLATGEEHDAAIMVQVTTNLIVLAPNEFLVAVVFITWITWQTDHSNAVINCTSENTCRKVIIKDAEAICFQQPICGWMQKQRHFKIHQIHFKLMPLCSSSRIHIKTYQIYVPKGDDSSHKI